MQSNCRIMVPRFYTFEGLGQNTHKELFRKAKLEEWGVVTWLNGTLDIAPEYLFFLINKTNPKFKNLFIQWGYLQ